MLPWYSPVMDIQTFFDILPAYLLLSLLPVAGLVCGAIIAPYLYATRRWLALMLNLAGLVAFVWVGCIVFAFAMMDFNPYYDGPLNPLVALLLSILAAALFFGAVEYLSFRLLRHLRRRERATAAPATTSALDYFHQGYSCAQSVVAPFVAELGLTERQALLLVSGFGAGIGRMRETCGAFCGLTVVAGHCRGNLRGEASDKEVIFSLVREEAERFRAEFGTLRCHELLKLSSDEQEGARPSERSAAYYAARPCERCVAFCETRARALLCGELPSHSPKRQNVQ